MEDIEENPDRELQAMYAKWQIYNSLHKLPSYWLKSVAAAEYAISVIRNTGSTKREKNYTLTELGDSFYIDYMKDGDDQVLRIKTIDYSLKRLVDQRFKQEFETAFHASNKSTLYQNTLEIDGILLLRKMVRYLYLYLAICFCVHITGPLFYFKF
jgi:hypothetical protein